MLDPGQLKAVVVAAIWDVDTGSLPAWRVRLIHVLRGAYAVIRDLADGQLTLRAMSLVYTTLLSMVPLLAVSFSVLKAFGVHNQVEPLLANVLAPLGDKGVEITARIIEFVENMKAGVLGSLGLALLVYTVIALIQKIERAFNFTWHIKSQRSFAQRFSDYLSVILIGPVLVFSAIGLTGTLMNTEAMQHLSHIRGLGSLIEVSGRLVPYVLIIAAFTFVYTFVPNTKVQFRSALVGAVVAGVLWETMGWAFASFIVTSTKYTVIYSAFATLIMFMIWLYVSWLILLVGASIAFYHQHPEYLASRRRDLQLSIRSHEELALAVMALIAEHHYRGTPAWTVLTLTQRLRLPQETIESMLHTLERAGLLARTAGTPTTFLPARPLETTRVKEVLDAVRADADPAAPHPHRLASLPAVKSLTDRLEQALTEALDGYTISELAQPQAHTPSAHAPEPTGGRRHQA